MPSGAVCATLGGAMTLDAAQRILADLFYVDPATVSTDDALLVVMRMALEQSAFKQAAEHSIRHPGRDIRVFELYYSGMTMKRVGEMVNLTRSRVDQIIWRMMRHLNNTPRIRETLVPYILGSTESDYRLGRMPGRYKRRNI
jgi:DNA-binding NarL/FixJ family response regulator